MAEDKMVSRESIDSSNLQNQSMVYTKSERKLAGSSSMNAARRQSRRLSRVSETVTVITDCARNPETCVLCGYGISYTQCLYCEFKAHNKCIEAFFCTTGKRVRLDEWVCPKCVTLGNMNGKIEEKKESDDSKSSQVDILPESQGDEPDCPFCRMDKNFKFCDCLTCFQCPKKNGDTEMKPPMQTYNKSVKHRDSSTKIGYTYLDNDDNENEEYEASIWRKICWSITWCLLLITFAFPIAMISSWVYIFTHCFDACCECCNPVCCFFLKGARLPGSCCRGISSGEPMCTPNENAELEKC